MEILVIGTEPPCIRCLTTYKRAVEVAQQFPGKIEVRKIAIHSKEAARFGRVESGHEIGEAGKVRPDIENMKRLMGELNELIKDEQKNENLIDARLKELEKVLLPLKEKARELGYLMTPVLIVDGQVKSVDYVPGKEEIQAWIEIERRRLTGNSNNEAQRINIKVFGTTPPCAKCKELTKRAMKVAEKYPGKIEVAKLDAMSAEGDKYGIMMTPTMVINDKVVSIGKVPGEADIEKMLKKEMGANS